MTTAAVGQPAAGQYELSHLRALEAESPGITRVRWSDDGGVIVD